MKHIPGLLTLCWSLFLAVAVRGEDTDRERLIQQSIQDVRVLSPEWICVVVDPTAEILAVREEQYGADLEAERIKYEAGTLARWYWPFSAKYRTLNIQKTYHQPLFAAFNRTDFWTLNGDAPKDVTVWSHSIDGFPNWEANDAPSKACSDYSRTADMVYLKLGRPLSKQAHVEVRGRDGRMASFAFDDEATPCWSLKVNQASYASDSSSKLAYLGQWLPGIGAMDFAAFEGRPFAVRAYEAGARWDEGRAVGPPLYRGEIRLRMKETEQEITREGGSNATGEDVYELDFSALTGEGLYCIHVPGLGRSWPFRIRTSGYADAFYTMMKGLFIQRCGCELSEPYTAWTRPACHTETHKGTFIPESEGWYRGAYRKGDARFGFRDSTGKRIELSAFTLIGNEDPEAPVLPGVRGGWHDAADFDRRIYHYGVVHDLLALFEFFPGRFADGQLNLPESENGIPDVLDEAAYGVEIWRQAQREDGAVCSWIEQESHPGIRDGGLEATFVKDQMTMLASIPDRTGSFSYAAAAAWLGRLLRPYDEALGNSYIASAERAFKWAGNPDHAMRDREFTIEKPMRNAQLKGQTIRFDEDPVITPEDRAYVERVFAAANLYLATKKESYRTLLTESEFGKRYPGMAWRINPVPCLPLIQEGLLPDDETAAIRKSLIEAADKLVASQDLFAYRMLWLGPSEGWFHTMAWGNIYNKTRNVVAAYALTKDPTYKTSLEAAANFFLGCNPMGQTMITGIGSVYPVVIQHIHSLADGIPDPTPGIAPYTFTFGMALRPFIMTDKGHPSVQKYFDPIALAFIPDKLGRAEIQKGLDQFDKTGDWTREAAKPGRAVIWNNVPVFRRKVTHPSAVVDQNEFTVNETVSPLALLFGALTSDAWSLPDEVRNRQPRQTIQELPYYSMP